MNERRGTKGLELWCRKMTEGYPGVKIDNMTTSWRDGLAFCAIIHHFRPDLIDFSKLNKNDVYHNNELAFRIAEQYLGIPALLEPEDMVEYTVPDRLSILTYLSQFYQAFAVREGASPARIAPKRPQSTTDHGIVSPASTSPPTKVVTKGPSLGREPCTKCGLPVFIAERLNVGKSLFHRTCFRCARCNSQLTLSNYYETESNEYCCEICPDEEKVMAKTTAQKALLQRSMSDEEKSASLKVVIGNEPDEFSAMFENALENADIEKAQTLTREFNSARSNFFQSQIVESSDSGNEEEDKPPDLPQSLPQTTQNSLQYDSGFPSKDVSVKVSFSDNLESQNVVTKESVVKARMRLFENDLKADVHSKKVPLSPNASIPSSIKRVDNSISENKKDTKYSKREEFKPSSGKEKFTSSISLKLNIDDDTDVNTKDSTSIDDKPKETSIEDPIILSDSSLNDSSIVDKPEETSVISIKDPSDSFINEIATTEISVITIEDSIEDSKSKIEEAIEAINCITSPQESSISNTGSPEKSSYLEDMSESNSRTSVQDSLEQNDFSFIDEVIEPIKETTETINYNVKDPIEEQISPDDKIIETINYRIKESDKNTVEAINERIKETFDQEQPVLQIEDNSITKSINDSSLLIIERKESYPDDLNPFDDEKINDSLNPFGSDDEKDELNPFENDLKKPQPSPRFKKKILDASHCRQIMQSEIKKNNIERVSINPFDSDEDDKRPVPVTRKKKISAPRISLEPWSDDENVPRNSRTSSRLSELKHKEPHSLSTSGYNFGGSNSSISSGSYYGSARKKRPAPKPPIPAFVDGSNPSSLASTPSHSVQHSPKTTPKYRKEKRAPPPPKLITSTPNPEEKIELSVPMESSKSQDELHKEKIVKDEVNRNRQSQDLQINEDSDQVSIGNKSTYGKWKRKKGLAPAKPIPQKRILKCLPMAEIKKELEFIEIQQQGLEKQGVRLEQIIREKCEGTENNATDKPEDDIPIEVEDLILQLFELVNEKNELFRKQTELMYLRRQQRLEEEHADVEYQIRCLMMQPEANKTDSDKAREEELIKRLVDIVERRNEIVECLEKDRVREAEEDDSINNHINLFTLNRDIQSDKSKSISEPTKKEKKKKEKKSKHKSKDKIDVDKDIDETETSINTLEKKKKKKFNLF